MKKRRRFLKVLMIYLILTIMIGSITPPSVIASINTQALHIEARSAILVEVTSGKVVYEFNGDQPFEPASMTKMMTEYLVLDAVKKGQISWDDVVITSDYGHYMGKYGGSRVFLGNGEKRTVRELFEAMAIYSANDATVMLAEKVSGSETNFVHLMNQKAEEFGMVNTHFLTSTGYPMEDIKEEFRPQVSGEHYMSANDAAILGRRLILDHPEVTEYTAKPRADFRPGTSNRVHMQNWNLLIPGLTYGYEGADGLKTGHTEAAKWCLTATAERKGLRFISVVMGAETEAKRFQETIKLLDFGFNNYDYVQMAQANLPIPEQETAAVSKGKRTQVTVVPEKPYLMIVRKGEESLYVPKVTTEAELLIAPFKKGTEVGKLTFEYTGSETYRYLTAEDEQNDYVTLIANDDVDKASWIRLFFRAIKNLIVGIFSGVSDTITGWFKK